MSYRRVTKFSIGVCLFLRFATAQQTVTYPEQGALWNDAALRQRYWFADQGSKIMPLSWFMKLKRADGNGAFAQGLDRYGFVPYDFEPPSKLAGDLNPSGLPIGFAVHLEGGEKWVGLTCAACHATRINFGNQALIVEGAPSMLNFDAFFGDMVDALRASNNSPTDLGADSEKHRKLVDLLTARRAMNFSPIPAGFARVDAFTQIFNQIAVSALGNAPYTSGVPNAPASYPFLWDIAQHEFLQWNGSAPNLGVGGTGSKLRNVGEVLGVFGEVTVPNPPSEMKYASSVNLQNLIAIEDWLEKLLPPQWPSAFPAPTAADVDGGKAVYERECVQCHSVLNRGELKYPTPIHMTPVDQVQTDRTLIDNFRLRKAKTMQLEGKRIRVDIHHPFEKFGNEALVNQLGAHVTIGALNNLQPSSVTQDVKDALKAFGDGTANTSAYKARPLDGIWATAPYLHNGSVPSLSELLKPARNRLREFCVGAFEYDPVNVGYTTECVGHSAKFDTTRIGNSNEGHEYGTHLSVTEKSQLLNYLKTL